MQLRSLINAFVIPCLDCIMSLVSIVINKYELRQFMYAYANNKSADQPVHPRSLINAFVIPYLDCIMSLVSIIK